MTTDFVLPLDFPFVTIKSNAVTFDAISGVCHFTFPALTAGTSSTQTALIGSFSGMP